MRLIFHSPSLRYTLLLAFGQLSFIIYTVSGMSLWDPFCKEDLLYTPYVRVFQRGRFGALLRERGPGFVDLTGLKDIYVCTNGLVMMYYAKTRGLGEVYEQGELHWTPHQCELYNPSPNRGVPGDHPKKTLLSILLIGHPHDYRRPAMQMFMAPMYDLWYKAYVNITSLIMIGTDGECLIEKGVERARLRVRNQLPKHLFELPIEQPRPPIFCKLDAHTKLGQRGVITIAKPGQSGLQGELFEFKPRPKSFKGTPFEKIGDKHSPKRETGSTIYPRYYASDFKEKLFPGPLGSFADAADEIYAALINDRKMRFVGCLHYPDFGSVQMKALEKLKKEYEELDLSNTGLLVKEADKPFWAEQVATPGGSADVTPIKASRYSLYLNVDVSSGEIEAYGEAKARMDAAQEDLTTKQEAKAEVAEVKASEINVNKEKMLISLWPLKKAYGDLYKHTRELEVEAIKSILAIHEVAGSSNELLSSDGLKDPESKKPVVLDYWKTLLLKNISEAKYQFRFEQYNRKLIDEYNSLVNDTGILSVILTRKSVTLGPQISNAETLIARHRVYKRLLKKTLEDFENAILQLERTGKPVDIVPVDPFMKYFVDTMIEIGDAVKEDLSPIEDNPQAKACHELPVFEATCKGIKPSSDRAGQLLRNRENKGRDWPPEDKWRGGILDLVEHIFQQVCPYINGDFASSVTRIVEGYLMANPLGTGLKLPVIGSRLHSVNHPNLTYNETNMDAIPEMGNRKLRPMKEFWKMIKVALEDCSRKAVPMQFWHNEDDKSQYITFRKFFQNNGSEIHYNVDDLIMEEKADLEYSFNWAVEMNWRIFATVLGICMPHYEKKIPLISARFYALYSEDFLQPLRQIWMSNRDNPVLQVILGTYFSYGKADRWTKACMESSFVESEDRNYRPPRHLYVNAFTEMNYFISGPMSGTSGILAVAENSL